jgi:hypothetical protein
MNSMEQRLRRVVQFLAALPPIVRCDSQAGVRAAARSL